MESAQSPSPIYQQESDSDISFFRTVLTTSAMEDPEPCSFNLRLIEAVRNSRCLYDTKDRLYRSADHKIRVWNRLVHTLNFDGDARTLYNRWKQLRDKYGKEKKKLKYGAEQTGWQYFKYLTFLDPHMVDRQQQQYGRKDGKAVMLSPGGTPRPIVINDPNFSMSLIQEVQQNPCLYDIRDPKYRHSECRNQAWAEIIKNLNFPGDINSIYKQWKKVRDRYVREKRKIRMSTSANGGEVEESQWDLFPQMMWIDPFLDDRATHYSRGIKRKHDSDDLSDDGYLDELTDGTVPHGGQHSVSQNHSPYTTTSVLLPAGIAAVHGGAQNTVTIAAGGNERPSQRTALITGGAMHQLQQRDMNAVDGDKSFALSVTADMLALPEHARAIVKAQIQNWLDNSRISSQQIVFDSK